MRKDALAELPLSWPTILFIGGTTVVAALWPLYAAWYGVTIRQVALAVAYFVTCGMSITVGYHRMISHRAFQSQAWLKVVFLLFGAAAWQGSALEWASDHVRHHSYTDTDKDPYNIKQGFWYAHVGWLFYKRPASPVPAFLEDDALIAWQHRYYIPIAVTMSFVVPYLLAGMGGLLLAGVVRLVLGHHVTWFINSWAHTGGRRPYNPEVSAADNWFLSLFTFGEGYHNYHHTFPSDYRNGIATFAWDPSKWLIWTFSLVGVTYDLKRIGNISQWKRRVRAAIERRSEGTEHFARLRRTRASLEKQIASSRAHLDRLLARDWGFEMPSSSDLEDLRDRIGQAMHDTTKAITAASRRKLDRARELLDALVAYYALLEQLMDHEASLAATA